MMSNELMKSKKKKSKGQNQVGPDMSMNENTYVSIGDTLKTKPPPYENLPLESTDEKNNEKQQRPGSLAIASTTAFVTNKWKATVPDPNTTATAYSRWKNYTVSKRKRTEDDKPGVFGRRVSLENSMGIHDSLDMASLKRKTPIDIEANKRLISYFARLGKSDIIMDDDCCEEVISLEIVDNLIKKDNASVNATDAYGQSVLHEVARLWSPDVARFLLNRGADVNKADKHGRTPLHVASAANYPEMVEFLIKHGADREKKTIQEEQTPVHFAARNDACESLKMLVKHKCEYKYVRDYKGRTPLHLAAELDRSETASLLLELRADAGVIDRTGQPAIVWMISKMAPVAKDALDQFHVQNRAMRKQYYRLHCLEPRQHVHVNSEESDSSDSEDEDKDNLKKARSKSKRRCDEKRVLDENEEGFPQTALQAIVQYRLMDLVQHPVITKMIHIKWRKYGMMGAIKALSLNLLFAITWTVFALGIGAPEKKHIYVMPDHWWRILVFALGGLLWIYQIVDEVREYYRSSVKFTKWKEWREKQIKQDEERTHPRWPEERAYLIYERKQMDKSKPQYFSDFWNYYDWFCYFTLLGSIISHIVDIFLHSRATARIHINIMAINVIILWLRIMKNARAFASIGPFIVMLGEIMSDVAKFGYLYLQFYVPFAFAFWMMFGGSDRMADPYYVENAVNVTVTVSWMKTVDQLLFTLFRLTVVDEYDYASMKQIDYWMADILVGTWLALSAILCLNLFIALLSDTFQRVYDNAQANSVMQKAILILSIEEGQSTKRRNAFHKFLKKKAKIPEDYDDDLTGADGEDLKKVTIQIKEQLDELQERLDPFLSKHNTEIDDLIDDDEGSQSDIRRPKKSKKQHVKSENSSVSSGENFVEKFENEFEDLKTELRRVKDSQENVVSELSKQVNEMKLMLQQITNTGVQQGTNLYDTVYVPTSNRTESQHASHPDSPDRHTLPPIHGFERPQSQYDREKEEKRRRKRLKKQQKRDNDQACLLEDDDLNSTGPSKSPLLRESSEPRMETPTVDTQYPIDPSSSAAGQFISPLGTDTRIRPTVLNMERMPSAEC